MRILRDRGWPDDILEAILGHGNYTGVPRVTPLAKTLFAVDELTGLITATALVRPSRSVHEVDARSVRKKMKDKAFARGVSRDDVVAGAADLGVDLDEHIDFVVGGHARSRRIARARRAFPQPVEVQQSGAAPRRRDDVTPPWHMLATTTAPYLVNARSG